MLCHVRFREGTSQVKRHDSEFAACIASTSASNGVPKSSTWGFSGDQKSGKWTFYQYHNHYKSLLSIELNTYQAYHVQYNILHIHTQSKWHTYCVCDYVTIRSIFFLPRLLLSFLWVEDFSEMRNQKVLASWDSHDVVHHVNARWALQHRLLAQDSCTQLHQKITKLQQDISGPTTIQRLQTWRGDSKMHLPNNAAPCPNVDRREVVSRGGDSLRDELTHETSSNLLLRHGCYKSKS